MNRVEIMKAVCSLLAYEQCAKPLRCQDMVDEIIKQLKEGGYKIDTEKTCNIK